jgi:hypothetical protein
VQSVLANQRKRTTRDPAMNVVQQGAKAANAQPCESRDMNDCEESLQRAIYTLRAIRKRYEAGRTAHPDARGYSVQLAVDCGDMAWITTALEVLETRAAAGTVPETASPRLFG